MIFSPSIMTTKQFTHPIIFLSYCRVSNVVFSSRNLKTITVPKQAVSHGNRTSSILGFLHRGVSLSQPDFWSVKPERIIITIFSTYAKEDCGRC